MYYVSSLYHRVVPKKFLSDAISHAFSRRVARYASRSNCSISCYRVYINTAIIAVASYLDYYCYYDYIIINIILLRLHILI